MSTQNTVGYNGFPIPIGTVFPYAGSNIPNGYLKCNGVFKSQLDYPQLYSVIGQTYLQGAPPSAGNFRLPDLENKYVKSVSVASGTPIPASASVTPFTIATANLPTIDNITVSGTLSGTISPTSVTAGTSLGSTSGAGQLLSHNSGITGAVIVTQNNPTTEPKLTYTPPGTVTPVTFSSTAPTSTPANIGMVYIIRALDSFI